MTCIPSLVLLVALCAAAEPPAVFHVRDYGALRDTPADAGPGIRAAIAAAAAHEGPAEVRLEAGIYRVVAPEAGATAALPLYDVADITLAGAGEATCIVVTDPTAAGVHLQRSERVTLRGFRIDYDPLPFTQGTVTALAEDGAWFDLRLDEGYLPPDRDCFKEAQAPWGLVVAEVPQGGEQFGPVPVWTTDWAPAGDGVWRGTVDAARGLANTGLRPGARFMHMARRYANSAVFAWQSRAVTLENVTVHASPATASMWGMNEDVTIRGLHVRRPADAGRLLSTNADGIHCLGNRGRLLIEDCSFEAMADDSINIHARAAVPLELPAPDRLLLNPAGTTEFRPGDHLQVYEPGEGRVRFHGVAVTSVEETHRGVLLTLDQSVEGTVTGNAFQNADHVFNLDACGAGAVIRSCTFGLQRGRGILVKTVGCTIEGNTFRNREGHAVAIHQLQDWGEGPAGQGVTIRGNTFEGQGTGWSPCIDIRPTNRAGAPALGRPVRDVRIEKNLFLRPYRNVLRAFAVDGLVFVNNTVNDAPQTAFPLLHLAEGSCFVVQDCQFGSLPDALGPAIRVDAGVDPGAEGLVMEGITRHPEGTGPVLDDRRRASR